MIKTIIGVIIFWLFVGGIIAILIIFHAPWLLIAWVSIGLGVGGISLSLCLICGGGPPFLDGQPW